MRRAWLPFCCLPFPDCNSGQVFICGQLAAVTCRTNSMNIATLDIAMTECNFTSIRFAKASSNAALSWRLSTPLGMHAHGSAQFWCKAGAMQVPAKFTLAARRQRQLWLLCAK